MPEPEPETEPGPESETEPEIELKQPVNIATPVLSFCKENDYVQFAQLSLEHMKKWITKYNICLLIAFGSSVVSQQWMTRESVGKIALAFKV